jgi:hypothetical protein
VPRGTGGEAEEDEVNAIRFDRERGQALIMVALMVVVLLGFVALALDVGNVYGGRRRMQNAADAGALAGARELCFGSGSRAQAKVIAEDYATIHNGAQSAVADIPSDGYTVTVVATQTLDTFFAGAIGIDTANVRAEAAALCGRAIRGGGMWPLAFKYDVYSDSIACGEQFLVFAQDDDVDCAGGCVCVSSGITETTPECEDKCDCNVIGPFIAPGDRGWLTFFEPEEGYPDDCNAHQNCGANELACWIRNNHPGPINIGDCVPGQPGVDAGVKDDVDTRIDDILNIILWDRECCDYTDEGCDDPEPLGTCPGTPYLVAAFGCVQVVGWEHTLNIPKCGNPAKTCQTGNNLKVVHAIKICDDPAVDAVGGDPYDLYCNTVVGATDGELPLDMELRAVSLVR